MCLACELEALWYAEAGSAGAAPGTAGVPPALLVESGNAVDVEGAERAGETPAVPAPRSRFLCEETGLE